MAAPVVFIIGAGKHIGQALGNKLKGKGYRVALGSRNPDKQSVEEHGFFPVKVDAVDVSSIESAFATVKAQLGTPNVVIYNAASVEIPPIADDPVSIPVDNFQRSVAIGQNVYVTAQQAIQGFRNGIQGLPKAFIVTGNVLPFTPPAQPRFFTLDLQKTILARIVENFSGVYAKEGFHFYFATLVGADGGLPAGDFPKSDETHANVYTTLIESRQQLNWDYRFTVDGKKYPGYDN